jgi:hypothetical protein
VKSREDVSGELFDFPPVFQQSNHHNGGIFIQKIVESLDIKNKLFKKIIFALLSELVVNFLIKIYVFEVVGIKFNEF